MAAEGRGTGTGGITGDAQFYVSRHEGVPKDEKEALKWLQKAAKKENTHLKENTEKNSENNCLLFLLKINFLIHIAFLSFYDVE